jgi:uncharacterized protein YdaU (DUF1376 family)
MTVFVRDALARMAGRDAAERGAAWSLMFGIWDARGAIVFDPRRLARLAGVEPESWDAIWKAISTDFEIDGDQLRHPTVTAEMGRAREIQNARRRGAEATNAQRRAERTLSGAPSERITGRSNVGIPSPSPSPSPSEAEETAAAASLAAFRRARDEAFGSNRSITLGEPKRDVAEFAVRIAAAHPDDLPVIGAVARLFFQRDGRGPKDQQWRRARWSLHYFSTQGIETLLPDVLADEQRRASAPDRPETEPPPPLWTEKEKKEAAELRAQLRRSPAKGAA